MISRNLFQTAPVFMLNASGHAGVARAPPPASAVMSASWLSVVPARLNMFGRMLMTVAHAHVHACAPEPLLLEENLARQFLFAVDEDIHLGRCDTAASDPRNFQARSDVQRRHRLFEAASAGTPASTRAPRNMSPLMPEKQSR